MCVAHGKRIAKWFENKETIELIKALAKDLEMKFNYPNSGNSTIAVVSAAFPGLLTTKIGSPSNGGGTWIHPDLAIQLAQWCNKPFAIQVSRWVREWMTIAYNNKAERKKQEQEARYNQRVIQACVSPDANPWQIVK